MGGSDAFQVPIADLRTISTNLKIVSEELEAIEKGVSWMAGVDDIAGAKLEEAVNEFFEEWKQSRKTLLENVGALGEVSGSIADQTNTLDVNMASDLNEFRDELKGATEQ